MKKFVANSNYNVTIYAENLKEAKKMYKDAVINSFLAHKEMIDETALEECEMQDRNFVYEKAFTEKALFYVTKKGNLVVNGNLYKIEYSGEYVYSIQKTQIKGKAEEIFKFLNKLSNSCDINAFFRHIKNVKPLKVEK